MIKMILAVDTGGAVGWSDGMLAYRDLKNDMAQFKALTTGHAVLMGFNTFKSLNRIDGLPNRKNIILTRRHPRELRGLLGDNISVYSSLEYISSHPPTDDLWIIGGASVYDEAIEKAIVSEIHMTLVHASCEADVRLKTDLVAWKLFVIRQRALGIFWETEVHDTEWDGDFQTTYIIFRKIA